MSFVTDLVVAPMPDGRRWYLKAPLIWEDEHGRVEVPAGFLNDFASVPRFFWWFISPWGKHGRAAVIHDWKYWIRDCERAEADGLFRRIMKHSGQILAIRFVMWAMVRAFGWLAWHGNAEDLARGVVRVMAPGEFPGPDAVAPKRGLDRIISVLCRCMCGAKA